MRWPRPRHCLAGVWLGLFSLYSGLAAAGSGLPEADRPERDPQPKIAIVIDDMGRDMASNRRVLNLPGPVACAFLPYEPHTSQLATQAHQRSHVVMLHLPMQTIHHQRLDRGAVTLDMTQKQLQQTLHDGLSRVPYAEGVNNHMGSLVTQHPGHMLWLMEALREQSHGLFFVDSRTTSRTVARQLAFEQGIPSIERDVFLDDSQDEDAILKQWRRLIRLAHRQGMAVAIGHPHPRTLKVLEDQLQKLDEQGVELVPITTLVEQQYARDSAWRLSLSR